MEENIIQKRESHNSSNISNYWWRRSLDERIKEIWTDLSELDNPLNDVEYPIIMSILRLFDSRHFPYTYEGAIPRLIRVVQDIKGTPCIMEIVLKTNGLLCLTLNFTREYTFSKLVYLSIFCNEFNSRSKYAFLVAENGNVRLKYSYMVETAEDIKENELFGYINYMISSGENIIDKVKNFC